MDKTKTPIHIISLGAGVQSSTMALMAARGELTPMPVAAIFSDTQAEPKIVMEYLAYLEKLLPFPVYRVTGGNLRAESLTLKQSRDGEGSYVRNVVPAFTMADDGSKGMLLRKCTGDFKIVPLKRKQRLIIEEHGNPPAFSWVGISTDEAMRMKPSGVQYITNVWPLIDKGMSRHHCLTWIKRNGYETPPKSACTFCPYHNDHQWRELRDKDPESFKDAVDFEKEWNAAVLTDKRASQTKSKIFLHRSCVPLDQVDFRTDIDHGQGTLNFFNNECEGMCGV